MGSLFLLPVLLHGQAPASLLLSQSRLLYTAVAGGGAIPSQSVAVINNGGGTLSWTAAAATLSGSGWLSVSPASGSSAAGATTPPQIDVQVNVTGLAPGVYDGNVRVDAAGVANSPLFVSVSLDLLPPGSNPGVLVRPTGLVFVQPSGGATPAAQTVRLTSTASASLDAVANPSTFAGGGWLTSTRTVTLSPGSPQTLSVQPSATSLAPGQYFGAVSLLFGDQTSASVNVLLLVTPPASVSCTPQKLLLADELGSNFGVRPNTGTVLQTQVKDDCGNPITDATVSASFSNGNPTLQLTHLGNGFYSATWSASGASPTVTVTLLATRSGLASAQVQRQGQILGPGSTQINSRGVVNGASFAVDHALAPGEIISIFGQNLTGSGNQGLLFATRLPLPTTLGSVSLTADGQPISLFFASPNQINAALPFELTPGSTVRIVARITSASGGPDIVSLPVTINIAESDPAIFATNSQGFGQGAILISNTTIIPAPSGSIPGRNTRPASPGEIVSIYCSGFGRTSPLVLTGQAAPVQPLATVVNPVQGTVGGLQADILFAGMAPGFAGLYQVNVRVPAGVAPGDAVPVVLTQRTFRSNTVTIAVR